MSVSACLFGIQAYALMGDYFAKKWNSHESEKTLIFVKLQVCLPAYPEYFGWCCIMVFALLIKLAVKLSSAILKLIGMPLNSSSIFFWNMSSTGTTLNGNHMCLFLPEGQENVNQYDDFSSNFRLCQPELAPVSVRYLTPASLGLISFNVGPLCTVLISL